MSRIFEGDSKSLRHNDPRVTPGTGFALNRGRQSSVRNMSVVQRRFTGRSSRVTCGVL
jgi:hypothetical protein